MVSWFVRITGGVRAQTTFNMIGRTPSLPRLRTPFLSSPTRTIATRHRPKQLKPTRMVPLPRFPLPLSPFDPPAGYNWAEIASSFGMDPNPSDTGPRASFRTSIEFRERFFGVKRCVICGLQDKNDTVLYHTYIIPQQEQMTWHNLQHRGSWVPPHTKPNPQRKPQNKLLLCPNHHRSFKEYDFFIRYMPDSHKFIFINYCDNEYFREYHGKAIALDIKDRRTPPPAWFIIHEMRVRGHHPFEPLDPSIPSLITWQDWIISHNVFDSCTNTFRR